MKKLTGMMVVGLVAGVLAGCGGTAPAPTADAPAGSAAPAMAAAYGCPMHKDVTSDKLGKCTKCGMALVPTASH